MLRIAFEVNRIQYGIYCYRISVFNNGLRKDDCLCAQAYREDSGSTLFLDALSRFQFRTSLSCSPLEMTTLCAASKHR